MGEGGDVGKRKVGLSAETLSLYVNDVGDSVARIRGVPESGVLVQEVQQSRP